MQRFQNIFCFDLKRKRVKSRSLCKCFVLLLQKFIENFKFVMDFIFQNLFKMNLSLFAKPQIIKNDYLQQVNDRNRGQGLFDEVSSSSKWRFIYEQAIICRCWLLFQTIINKIFETFGNPQNKPKTKVSNSSKRAKIGQRKRIRYLV